MDAASKFACLVFGFNSSGGARYPCHWCGILTTLLDAEDFFVCEQCQREYIVVGYDEMKNRHPLSGEDERNPLFFKEQTERHLARGKSLTKVELEQLINRSCEYERQYAQAILDGKTIDDEELEQLGRSAEQYIDGWEL